MNFINLLKTRYSVRKYEAKKVENEKLQQILEAAHVAPSGQNRQPVKLIVVQQAEGLNKVKKAANIFDAPLVIIACGDHNTAGVIPFNGKSVVDIDTSIATDHMMLQASALGLGTVWICGFDPTIISREFTLPDYLEPINILAIGYAAGEPASPDRHVTTRKPLSEIVAYEKLDH
ncbi:nitroreductase [Sporomusaceae bacterium FL31]|nr:nitroreductase [Sporomusaceae bacterium FL31]GCE34984.1 nitroreductase [Sporomusaceae bacterium]